MKDELGISVGIKTGHTTNWYRAHALNRRKDGAMVAFALNDERTPVRIKAKEFAGVAPGIRCHFNQELNPDILEILKESANTSN